MYSGITNWVKFVQDFFVHVESSTFLAHYFNKKTYQIHHCPHFSLSQRPIYIASIEVLNSNIQSKYSSLDFLLTEIHEPIQYCLYAKKFPNCVALGSNSYHRDFEFFWNFWKLWDLNKSWVCLNMSRVGHEPVPFPEKRKKKIS